MKYHHWTEEEGFRLPPPSGVNTLNEVEIDGKKIQVGIGIHDSSSSLAPYFCRKPGEISFNLDRHMVHQYESVQ